MISGFGWEQNVEHAMAVIKAINAGSNQKIEVINMAGWSRGAVACHMLPHALHADEDTKQIRVNIVALDPVPGPGNCFRYTGIMRRAQRGAREAPVDCPDDLPVLQGSRHPLELARETPRHGEGASVCGPKNMSALRLRASVANPR
jgi:hypothetical protein